MGRTSVGYTDHSAAKFFAQNDEKMKDFCYKKLTNTPVKTGNYLTQIYFEEKEKESFLFFFFNEITGECGRISEEQYFPDLLILAKILLEASNQTKH